LHHLISKLATGIAEGGYWSRPNKASPRRTRYYQEGDIMKDDERIKETGAESTEEPKEESK
jgi:hypothetical protein